jgi:hypothetical protein
MSMRYIFICGLFGSTTFFHIISNGTISEKKKLLNTKCVFWFSLKISSETVFILRTTERDMIINVYWSCLKLPVILVRFYWNLTFVDIFFEKYSNIKFRENPSSGSLLAPRRHTDGRTDMTKLVVTFRSFANAPNNELDIMGKEAVETLCRYHWSSNAEGLWKKKNFKKSLNPDIRFPCRCWSTCHGSYAVQLTSQTTVLIQPLILMQDV